MHPFGYTVARRVFLIVIRSFVSKAIISKMLEEQAGDPGRSLATRAFPLWESLGSS